METLNNTNQIVNVEKKDNATDKLTIDTEMLKKFEDYLIRTGKEKDPNYIDTESMVDSSLNYFKNTIEDINNKIKDLVESGKINDWEDTKYLVEITDELNQLLTWLKKATQKEWTGWAEYGLFFSKLENEKAKIDNFISKLENQKWNSLWEKIGKITSGIFNIIGKILSH